LIKTQWNYRVKFDYADMNLLTRDGHPSNQVAHHIKNGIVRRIGGEDSTLGINDAKDFSRDQHREQPS
jgi:hypothetical protein